MLREIFYQILELEMQETGKTFVPATNATLSQERFGPREGHTFFEELHDYLTWPETPGVANPKPPKFFS